MYQQVGRYGGDLSVLAERIHALRPAPTQPLGYLTTDSAATMALYRPLLDGFFPGEWLKCFLSIVWPNGSIMPHQDLDAAGRHRQHLVIKTNPDSWCMHDGTVQQLDAGGVYIMDQTRVHAAMNWGADVRVHLVVDRLTGELG